MANEYDEERLEKRRRRLVPRMLRSAQAVRR